MREDVVRTVSGRLGAAASEGAESEQGYADGGQRFAVAGGGRGLRRPRGKAGATQSLRDRLHIAMRGHSCRAIARLTEHNPETVRRYMATGTPSVVFLIRVCDVTGVRAEWLLLGRGAPTDAGESAKLIAELPIRELLAELAGRWEKLSKRVDEVQRRMERAGLLGDSGSAGRIGDAGIDVGSKRGSRAKGPRLVVRTGGGSLPPPYMTAAGG